MQRRRFVTALVVAASGTALAVPGGAAAAPSCVGQVAGAPKAYPGEVADFVTTFAGPGYGGLVSGFARQDRAACPPLPPIPG